MSRFLIEICLVGVLLVVATTRPARGQEGRDAGEARATLVRVVDKDGERVAKASVYSLCYDDFHVPRSGAAIRTACDEQGRARLVVSETKPTWIWAVVERDSLRFASIARCLYDSGRPQTLVVHPYPVPKVRVMSVAAWRKLLPEGAKLSYAFVSEGPPHARFDVAALDTPAPRGGQEQEGQEDSGHVFDLPPLPYGNYFNALIDEAGLLSLRYYSPAFMNGSPQVEELYERDVPLKRIYYGEPIERNLEVAIPKGAEGADFSLGQALVRAANPYDGCQLERKCSFDAQGRAKLLFAKHTKGTGWLALAVHALVPGYRPGRLPLAEYPEQANLALKLEVGEKTSWRIEGTAPGDRLIVVTTPIPIGSFERVVYDFDVTAALPSFDGPLAAETHAFLSRGAVLRPLHIGQLPSKLAVHVEDALIDVTIVAKNRERVLPRAWVEVVLGNRSTFKEAISLVTDDEGRCSLRMPPGRATIYVASSRQGAVLASIDLAKSGEYEVCVEPYATFTGKVTLHEHGVPATLSIRADFRSFDPRMLDRWVRVAAESWRADDQGRFRIDLPAFVPVWTLNASWQTDGERYHYGNALLETRDADKPISIALSL